MRSPGSERLLEQLVHTTLRGRTDGTQGASAPYESWRYGSSLSSVTGRPQRASAPSRSAERDSRSRRGYTTPVGLLGESTTTTRVRGVSAAATASRSSWNVTGSADTSTQRAPADSTQTRYSGKHGTTRSTSSPGAHRACSAQHTEAAAPHVRNRSPAVAAPGPNWRRRLAATASRASGRPAAGV